MVPFQADSALFTVRPICLCMSSEVGPMTISLALVPRVCTMPNNNISVSFYVADSDNHGFIFFVKFNLCTVLCWCQGEVY